MNTLTIVVPVFNEEDNIPKLLVSLFNLRSELERRNVFSKILFTDNHSTDSSWNQIQSAAKADRDISAIRLTRNFGYQASILNAFRHVQTESLVVYQSDMQDPIEMIPEMVDLWLKGARTIGGQAVKRSENVLDRLSRRLFYRFMNFSSSSKHPNGIQDFYLLDQSVYRELQDAPFEYQFIRSKISQNFGFEKIIKYNRKKREQGKTKFKFIDKVNLALDGLLLNNVKFRQYLVLSSLFCSLIFLLSSLSILLSYVFGWRTILGWVPIVLLEMLILSVVLFGFAIIFEVISRLYRIETSPLSLRIEDKINLDGKL